MSKHGKRYEAAVATLERDRPAGPDEALQHVKEMASAKFDETVEVAIRLGVDARSGEQTVRGTVVLPHGTGKSPRVVAFAQGEQAQAAEEAGADAVGGEDLVKKIEGGWKDFDVLVAARDMMRVVGRLGKRLGPRMPNPKAGTVGEDLGRIVRDLKSGQVQFRMDRGGNLQVPIGKASYSIEQLTENFGTLILAVMRAKPAASKGQYLRKIAVSSTMGPSVFVDQAQSQALAETLM
ncbi:MAG: 50S ribosomal protein L1 [Armatimonadetes bacterium]|nr:50S ribosomal protein L1 [Armatimonadota bacterium]